MNNRLINNERHIKYNSQAFIYNPQYKINIVPLFAILYSKLTYILLFQHFYFIFLFLL
jgi:hypothetical protein